MITVLDCVLGLLPEQETLVTKGLNMTPENQPFLKQLFLVKMAHFRLNHAYVLNVKRNLPGPCTTFCQSLSVNSLRWPIRGEHFRLDDVTPSALAARNNEAKGLGKSEFKQPYDSIVNHI